MAVTTTTRFGITRWSAGTDPFSRAQMDASHAAIEALGAIYGQGTLAARPTAGTQGRYYTVRGDGTTANNGRVFYDDGSAWFEVGANVRDMVVRPSAAGVVGLQVIGFGGQTANLQEWKNSTGSTVGSVSPNGSVTFGPATLQATSVTTLTATGAVTLSSTLTVTGTATFNGAVNINGTLKPTNLESTSTRSGSGLPKTEINGDGTGRLDFLIPPGFYMCSLRSDVPAGWLRMEGQSVAVATYRDLWEALGSPGGVGATTFTIPDWRNRTTVGVSTTKALMSTGGSATMTLTVNHMPAHDHTIAHTHTVAHSHDISHTHTFAHTHSIDHDHPNTSTSSAGSHSHGGGTGATSPGYYGVPTGLLDTTGWMLTTSPGGYANRVLVAGDGFPSLNHGHSIAADGTHSHTLDVPAFSGSTGGASTTTTSAASTSTSGTSTPTTSASSAANSGSTGSGTAFSIESPYGAGYWVIKT